MIRNLIIGLLLAGVITTPAFSYTGALETIPTIEHIDETFGGPVQIKVKAEPKTYRTNPIRHKDVFIILNNGKPVSKSNVGYNTDKFVQVVVKKTGKYKYKTNDSMSINNKLKKKKTKQQVTGFLNLKKGDVLMFRNRNANFEMSLEN